MLKSIRKLIGDLHYAINLRDHALANYMLPSEKREYLAKFATKFSTFVETGTYLGETAEDMSKVYQQVYTIELMEEFYSKAENRFKNKNHVKCFQGNSADVLSEILADITSPAVFWLDAHYSGGKTARHFEYDSPIKQELSMIFEHNKKDHIILIDDARLFIGRNSYPTISILNQFVRENSDYSLTIYNDIIRLIHDPEW